MFILHVLRLELSTSQRNRIYYYAIWNRH